MGIESGHNELQFGPPAQELITILAGTPIAVAPRGHRELRRHWRQSLRARPTTIPPNTFAPAPISTLPWTVGTPLWPKAYCNLLEYQTIGTNGCLRVDHDSIRMRQHQPPLDFASERNISTRDGAPEPMAKHGNFAHPPGQRRAGAGVALVGSKACQKRAAGSQVSDALRSRDQSATCAEIGIPPRF